eukprot:COSAG05_NODE_787_length_7335_cov_30.078220_3_plen_87_part_00
MNSRILLYSYTYTQLEYSCIIDMTARGPPICGLTVGFPLGFRYYGMQLVQPWMQPRMRAGASNQPASQPAMIHDLVPTTHHPQRNH